MNVRIKNKIVNLHLFNNDMNTFGIHPKSIMHILDMSDYTYEYIHTFSWFLCFLKSLLGYSSYRKYSDVDDGNTLCQLPSNSLRTILPPYFFTIGMQI